MRAEDLARQTRKALLALAKQHGLTRVSRLPKQTLLDQLRELFNHSAAEGNGMRAEDLARQTRKALLALAKQHGLTGVSRLPKQALLDQLRELLTPRLQAPPKQSEAQPSASPYGQPAPFPSEGSFSVPLTSSPRVFPSNPSEQQMAVHVLDHQHSSSTVVPTSRPEQEAADSKFFLGPQLHAEVSEPDSLPASYNDNRIVLLARDPHWLYAYWDYSGAHLSQAQNRLHSAESRLILRVFDVTYVEFNGANAWSTLDIELAPLATNWYIAVPQADAAYCAEIGYHSRDGQFVSLGRSNVIVTPRAEPSPSTTVRWFTPPERRATTHPSAQPPRSPLTWSGGGTNQDAAFVFPAPSSAEHPFSWGIAPKR
jgi:hypothetical protein